MYADAARVAGKLGGRRILGREVRTTADLEAAVERGLPYRSFTYFVRAFAGRRALVAERVARIVASRTTLQRREQSGTLNREESERLERIARVAALAEQVWESAAAAEAFLTTPHSLLGGATPLDTAQSELGARRVEALLWQLEYSLPV